MFPREIQQIDLLDGSVRFCQQGLTAEVSPSLAGPNFGVRRLVALPACRLWKRPERAREAGPCA